MLYFLNCGLLAHALIDNGALHLDDLCSLFHRHTILGILSPVLCRKGWLSIKLF